MLIRTVNIFVFCMLSGIAPAGPFVNNASYKYEYYTDNNGVRVHTNVASVQKAIGENVSIQVQGLVDGITGATRGWRFTAADSASASSTRYRDVPSGQVLSVDAVTSATTKERRSQIEGGLDVKIADLLTGCSASASNETDYFSRSGSARAQFDCNNHNTTLSATYTYFYDHYAPVGVYSGQGGLKQVHNASAGLMQTVTARTLAGVSLTGSSSLGYLGRPYYPVLVTSGAAVAGGAFYKEQLPDTRDFLAVVGQVLQHYPSFICEGSAKLEYRLYKDTWENLSHTVSLTIDQYLVPTVYASVRYRYYRQSGVWFYRDRYTTDNLAASSASYIPYLTVDERLAPLQSHLASLRIVFLVRDFIKPSTEGLVALFPTKFDIEALAYNRTTVPDADVRRIHYEYFGKDGLWALVIRSGIVLNF